MLDFIGYQAGLPHNVVNAAGRRYQIGKTLTDGFHNVALGIKVEAVVVYSVNFAQIIYSVKMVCMSVRVKNAVQPFNLVANQLQAQVRGCVNQNCGSVEIIIS